MISSGPCMTHCGSRVSVGVKVEVGRTVSDGGAAGVSVGDDVSVTVADRVGEGGGVAVNESAIVGVGETTSCNPPHPMSDRASADTQKINFLVIAEAIPFYGETWLIF